MSPTPRPIVPSDLCALALVADPQIAPSGRFIAYVRGTIDPERDAVRTAIWRVDAHGASPSPRPLTRGRSDAMPRISPDERRIAFVGDRHAGRGEPGGKRIFVLPLDGGEAEPVCGPFARVTALAWSPDGRRIAFVATAPHDRQTARIALDRASGARHIRGLPFKSDDLGLLDGTRMHLFVVDLPAAAGDGASPEQVTFGDFDVGAAAWSPDGRRIAFSASIDVPEDRFVSDLFILDLASRERRRLTCSDGPKSLPAFSPDGTTIACLGHRHGDDAGGRFNEELLLIAADATGDAERDELVSLSARLDRTANDVVLTDARGAGSSRTPPQWSPDGREIVVALSDAGCCSVVAFAADASRAPRTVVGGERVVFAFSVARSADAVAFAYATPLIPAALAVVALGSTASAAPALERRLTHDNDAWLAERRLTAPQRLRPRAADGTMLDLFLMRPAPGAGGDDGGDDADTVRRPLVLEVHGGPHAAYGFAFFFEFQMLASLGLCVAYGNPRGSQSYGAAYADAISDGWGGVDASDVLRMLDAAVAVPGVDGDRVAIVGGSYGGFMTTWLLGHADRFACGISMRAVNDFVSEIGAADIGWFLEQEIRAPWSADGGRALFEASPIRAAAAIEAPLLIMHSERDYRCPIDQGEQLFTLLRRLGKRVEFVRFSGDGHGLSRTGTPRNRVLRLRAIAHWLRRHLVVSRTADAAAPDRAAGWLFAPLDGEPEIGPARRK